MIKNLWLVPLDFIAKMWFSVVVMAMRMRNSFRKIEFDLDARFEGFEKKKNEFLRLLKVMAGDHPNVMVYLQGSYDEESGWVCTVRVDVPLEDGKMMRFTHQVAGIKFRRNAARRERRALNNTVTRNIVFEFYRALKRAVPGASICIWDMLNSISGDSQFYQELTLEHI